MQATPLPPTEPTRRQPVASTSLAPALLGPAPWGQAPSLGGCPSAAGSSGPGRAGPQGQPPPRPPGPALPRPRATDPASPRPRCSWWRIADLPAALGSQGCRSPDGSHGSSSGPGGACGGGGSLELPSPPGAAPPPGDAQSALITNCTPQPFPSPPPSPCPSPSIAALLSSPPRLGLKRGKFPQNATCGASVSGSGPEPLGSLPRPGPAAGTCGARGAPSRPAAPVVIAIKAGNMWRHMAGSRCWGGSLVLALHLFISCV